MALQFFTIPIQQANEAAQELNRFLATHRVLVVDRRFVDCGVNSFWTVCVDYLPSGQPLSESPSSRKVRVDYRQVLNEADFQVFARLRELRKQLAEKQAVPVYNIFTNEQLAQMVTQRVTTKTALAAIEGIGEPELQPGLPRGRSSAEGDPLAWN
jgi:superfamily II DNA helicase RecQ